MRLAIASYFYPPSVGGVERQTELLARALAARGHRIEVLTRRMPGAVTDEVQDGVRVRRLPEGRGSRYTKMAGFLFALCAEVTRRRAALDLVQVQQALYPAAALAPLCRALGLPLVVRNSGSGEFGAVKLMQRLPLGSLGLRMIARVATTVSLSAPMTTELREAGFERICEIRNGVAVTPPLEESERQAIRKTLGSPGRVVLCVARLDREKGVDLLLSALRHIEDPSLRLWIVGGGPLFGELARDADPRASFLGERGDVPRLLGAADLFVLPSRSEGTSNALLEAMAAGVPCIATDVDGNREVVRPSGERLLGQLVTPENPASIALAIAEHFASPGRGLARAAAARAFVTEHLSIDAMVRKYEALYETLVR